MIHGLKNNAVHSDELRKRGRPPNPDGRMAPLTVRVPQNLYERMCRNAEKNRQPLQDFIRRTLDKNCK